MATARLLTIAILLFPATPKEKPAVEPTLADNALEIQITQAQAELDAAHGREEQQRAWGRMCKLISQRSPRQVAFMEKARGLQ